MLLYFLGLLAGVGLLGPFAWRIIRRHSRQEAAVVRLAARLCAGELEGALRGLKRQAGGFRRVYLVESGSGERRRLLQLLCRELGFYPVDRSGLQELRQREHCQFYVLDRQGRLHKYKA